MTSRRSYLSLAGGRIGLMRIRASSSCEEKRFVCFPFGGGGPTAFIPLAQHLPSSWSIWAIDPPGHVRTRGEPLTDVAALSDLYLEHLPSDLLDGSILLGHSLGGYVALALGEKLESRGTPAEAVFMGAAPPPYFRDHRSLSSMNDEQLFDWLLDMGGLPGNSEDQRELFEIYRHVLRADILAYERFVAPERTLERTPVYFLGGSRDAMCPVAELFGWRDVARHTEVEVVDGTHLFLLTNPRGTAAIIEAILSRSEADLRRTAQRFL